jgi:hypothetical protein
MREEKPRSRANRYSRKFPETARVYAENCGKLEIAP